MASCAVVAALLWEPTNTVQKPIFAHHPAAGEEPAARDISAPRRVAPPEPANRSDTATAEAQESLARKAVAVHQEVTLIQRLRDLKFSDPERSIRLAEDFDAGFPDSDFTPERAWYQARNLVYLKRFDEARALATRMLEQYPDDSWSRDLSRHLLSHPFGLPPRDH